MILSKFNEEERRAVAALLVHPGWKLLQREYMARKDNLVHDLVYSTDRTKDADRRALAVAIDMLFAVDKEFFSPPAEQPFQIVPPPTGSRYSV